MFAYFSFPLPVLRWCSCTLVGRGILKARKVERFSLIVSPMDYSFFAQYADFGILFLRLVIAVIFLKHGWLKVKNPGMFVGLLKGTNAQWFTLGVAEVALALFIATGVLYTLGALLLVVIMLGAIYFKIVKWKVPFITFNGTGWEYDLALLGAGVYMLCTMPGAIVLALF